MQAVFVRVPFARESLQEAEQQRGGRCGVGRGALGPHPARAAAPSQEPELPEHLRLRGPSQSRLGRCYPRGPGHHTCARPPEDRRLEWRLGSKEAHG